MRGVQEDPTEDAPWVAALMVAAGSGTDDG
jgi:hypothetical protein